jgi:hypothetical protein
MQELRVVAVSEDGSYAVMVAPGRSGRFMLPIDDRLRAVARGQFSRLAQYAIEVENPLRPKEIQDRIRAGESADEIADAAGLPVERVRRFEGPILAEREHRAREAQRATVRGVGEPGPGPRLGEIVSDRLSRLGSDPEDAAWDSRKRSDGNWDLELVVSLGGSSQLAEWVYDPRSRHVTPANDSAARLCVPDADWPAGAPGASGSATATVTPIGARLPQPAGRPAAEWSAAQDAADGAADRLAAGVGASPRRTEPGRARMPAPAASLATPASPATASGAGPAARSSASDADGSRSAAEPGGGAESAADAGPAERRARRVAGARPRRSSVPSWDEIMFGTSRPGGD